MSSHEQDTPATDAHNRTQVQQLPESTSSDDVNSTSPNFGTFTGPSVPGYPFLSQPQASGEIGRLGDYRVLAKLGEGGMGFVFRAEDPALKRFVALKVMRPEVAAKPHAADRFLREGRAAAGLKSDHVITIYQVGQANGAPFIAMEYLEGIALDEWMKQQKKAVPVAHVLRVVRDTLRGLATAHDKGLIHRDIKPANLWIEKGTARIKVLDFGLTRGMDGNDQMTADGAVVGTPAYMAPEQAAGKPVDPRADLFSVGTVMYQLFLGINPFVRSNMMATMGAVTFDVQPPVIALRPEVPQAYSDYLDRLLAKDPAGRPANAKAALAELAAIEKSLQDTAKTLASSSNIPVVSMMAPAAAPVAAQVWGDITESDDAVVRTKISDPETPRKPPSKKLLIGSGLFAFFALILGGIVIIITNKDGTKTKIEVPEGAKVEIVDKPIPPEPKRTNPQSSGPQLPAGKNSIGIEFVKVPKGTAWLGGGAGKPGETKVEFKEDFYLGKYEVTQQEWEAVMGANPSHFSRNGVGKDAVKEIPDADQKRFPVEQVSWDDCQIFIKKLNEKEKESGWVYRLPKSMEWEYACRGGPVDKSESAFDFYFAKPTNTLLPKQANFDNVLKRTCQVGSYQPNLLGLHDMHGNVHEFCDDATTDDGGAPVRVIRGGYWSIGSERCRAANGHATSPSFQFFDNLGLRLARLPNNLNIKAAGTDPDRRAAEYVLKHGGIVQTEAGEVTSLDKLPREPFKIRQLDSAAQNTFPTTDGDLDLFRPLAELVKLSVRGPITDAGLAKIAEFPAAGKYNNLILIGSQITDDGLKVMPRFKKLGGLTLGSESITGRGLVHLQGLAITHLGLGNGRIEDAGLAHLKLLPKLENFSMYQTAVTDAGVKHIGELKTLTALQISKVSGLTDAGLKHFEGLTMLKDLTITGTKVTAAGVKKFRAARPECKVTSDFPE